MSDIHPTAIIEDGAKLGAGVKVGPYSIIGAQAEIGEGTELVSHVVIAGKTVIGAGCKIYSFASLGQPPQHLRYAGEDVSLIIGDRVIIREYVTMNAGTAQGRGRTVVGSDGFFMTGAHVAHDAIVGDHVVFTNNAVIGGHVEVGDNAILGGGAAVHQWARIGRHAFVGGMAGLENDLIPFGSCLGNRAYLAGLNIVGMKRRGFSREKIHTLRNAYRLMFAPEGTFQERVEDVASLFAGESEVMEIVDFVRADSNRAMCMPRPERAG